MQEFFGWFHRQFGTCPSDSPWLVLGKGPSYAKRSSLNHIKINGLTPKTLGLNDVVRDGKIDIAHCIDFDVVTRNTEALIQNAGMLVMPWHPHVACKASTQTLADFLETSPVLRQLSKEGRLSWYNLQTAKDQQPGSPKVGVRYFSAEAAINLLAMGGVKSIRTLGVDGGDRYSSNFDDLKDKSLLSNGRASFDAQFSEIAKSILNFQLDLGPLDDQTPIKIFVGTQESQMIATKVLEYSIRKHSSYSIELNPLHLANIEIPLPNDKENHPRTPFSFQRFLIPQLCHHQGRAIYLDSDMLVFKDIRSLWSQPMRGADIVSCWEKSQESGRRPQFSVMMMDCQRLNWNIAQLVSQLDSGKLTYRSMVYEMAIAKEISASLEPHWNSLEQYVEGETSLLHYTDMEKQPWVKRHNPLAHLWCQELIEAVQRKFISREELERHVQLGWIRPSLIYQVDHGIADPRSLPRKIAKLDANFVAPFELLLKKRGQKLPSNARTNFLSFLRRMKLKTIG